MMRHRSSAWVLRSWFATVGSVGMVGMVATGCASVEPWQRGTLATDHMALDPSADELAMDASRRRTREEGIVQGGTSASGSAGGSCGCH